VPFPDLVPFDRVQGVARPDSPEQEQKYLTQWRLVRSALFQLDTMEVLVSLLASGACDRYPEFNFVLGESGVTWLPYVFDRLDTEYADRARSLNFKLKPSDYFRRQGYVTYQQDQFLEPIIPLIGEDNIIWGADYPHPDCIWPGSRATLDRDMANIAPTVRRKITSENVSRLYQLHQ
jgi:predicted TIM-barrel fold metal-dependent hydrolase